MQSAKEEAGGRWALELGCTSTGSLGADEPDKLKGNEEGEEEDYSVGR